MNPKLEAIKAVVLLVGRWCTGRRVTSFDWWSHSLCDLRIERPAEGEPVRTKILNSWEDD